MSEQRKFSGDEDAIEKAASAWVLKHDRGLTPEEQDDFSLWLASDPRHGAAFSAGRLGWEELDRLAGIQTSLHAVPDPDLLKATGDRRRTHPSWSRVALPLAAALALVAGSLVYVGKQTPVEKNSVAFSQVALSAPCERRTLEDGSVVELNRGAELVVSFTPDERRVFLQRGEAHFTVAKNPAQPFIVTAQGVEARAIGTAFNVKLDASAMEVVVTEGRVQVVATPQHGLGENERHAPVVSVGQRAVVDLLASTNRTVVVDVLSAKELEDRMAWQPRLLDFNSAPLSQIVSIFNRHNRIQLIITDSSLANFPLSATFRSDNVSGFVRLLQADFGVNAEWRGENQVLLSRSRAP